MRRIIALSCVIQGFLNIHSLPHLVWSTTSLRELSIMIVKPRYFIIMTVKGGRIYMSKNFERSGLIGLNKVIYSCSQHPWQNVELESHAGFPASKALSQQPGTAISTKHVHSPSNLQKSNTSFGYVSQVSITRARSLSLFPRRLIVFPLVDMSHKSIFCLTQ